MTQGKQWKLADLPLADVRALKNFQYRVNGIDQTNLNSIMRTLEAGEEARDPIRVARVGRVLYLVDGSHRLEAYRRAGRRTIPAAIAKMSLGEAREEAKGSNVMNGKPYTLQDRAALFVAYVAEGRHKNADGSTKPCREIARDRASGGYSHETVRKKLKAMGIELDAATEYGGHYKPLSSGEELEEALVEDLELCLSRFGEGLLDAPIWKRAELLGAAKEMLSILEKGERPDMQAVLEAAKPF